jgi:4-amino-4-deoxy-L-arabinose transferase-like glycosyltransferase
MGYLVILLSTYGGLLLYGICKKLFNDKQTALYALIFYALIPCKLFFFPILNTVTPVFILLCLYLFLVYIEGKQILFLWLFGGTLYLLILFEPTPLVTGLVFIGIILNAIGEKRFSKKDFLRLLIFPTLAFLVVYLFFLVVFSFNLLHTLQYVLSDAVSFNSRDNRSYWIWAAENPKEFFWRGYTRYDYFHIPDSTNSQSMEDFKIQHYQMVD